MADTRRCSNATTSRLGGGLPERTLGMPDGIQTQDSRYLSICAQNSRKVLEYGSRQRACSEKIVLTAGTRHVSTDRDYKRGLEHAHFERDPNYHNANHSGELCDITLGAKILFLCRRPGSSS